MWYWSASCFRSGGTQGIDGMKPDVKKCPTFATAVQSVKAK